MNKSWTIANAIALLMATLAIAGCEEEVTHKVERIRAIKPFTVNEPGGGIVRRFAGKIAASESSALSFAVPGTVAKVNVAAGDKVKQGQVLASLDTKTFDLDVQAAKSELRSAQAKLTEARHNQKRKSALFKKGWVTKAAYDTALAKATSAVSAVEGARSQLGRAQRDLSKTRLLAPFDGAISKRDVEPFAEIKVGSTLFEINASGSKEIKFSVPDTIVRRLSVGLQVDVVVSALAECGCRAHITEIGSASGQANAVNVTAALVSSPNSLLPGMAGDVRLTLVRDGAAPSGYLVPLSTIVSADKPGTGFVFKYDRKTGTVRKSAITGHEGRDNLVQVTKGVEAGDILAAAGVSFLRDGQKVKLLGE
ncbi:MAG: efflux RND transporter periplasmic adaptor subunit [Gammaproteobacteria bacterium]|nr:efflux RND transporter periplasmic adaptor subunit [Gammaproteobacteria bacterium]